MAGGGHVERRAVQAPAIDRDPALGDQAFGLAPRADSGPGDRLGDALAFIRGFRLLAVLGRADL